MKMKDNKKLEEFLDTKVGELGKKYFERFVEEGKKIVENAKDEFNNIVEEDDDEPEVEDPLNIEDLYDRYDELTEVTVKRFNNILKSKGVNTDLYSLYKYDHANMNIFGDPYLNCTVEGILDLDFMPDMMIYLLKIAEKVCNAVDYKDFKLVKIRMDEENRNSDDDFTIFDVIFKSNTYCYDTIKVGFCEVLEGEFDPDNDIFIKNYAKLSIDGKKFIPSILPSGITNGEIGPITSTFTSGGEFNYNDVKAYNKIALAMKTNRENLEDKFKSIINMGILGENNDY